MANLPQNHNNPISPWLSANRNRQAALDDTLRERIKDRDLDGMKNALLHGANPNANDGIPLYHSVGCDLTDFVNLLLAYGANFNFSNSNLANHLGNNSEQSLLIMAVNNHNLQMIKILIEHGINLEQYGANALALTIGNPRGTQIGEYLVQEMNKRQCPWENTFHLAVRAGDLPIVKAFIKTDKSFIDAAAAILSYEELKASSLDLVTHLSKNGGDMSGISESAFRLAANADRIDVFMHFIDQYDCDPAIAPDFPLCGRNTMEWCLAYKNTKALNDKLYCNLRTSHKAVSLKV